MLTAEQFVRLLSLQAQEQPTGAGLYPAQLDRVLSNAGPWYDHATGHLPNQDTNLLGRRGTATAEGWQRTMAEELERNRAAGELSRWVNPATGQPIRQTNLSTPDWLPPPFGVPAFRR